MILFMAILLSSLSLSCSLFSITTYYFILSLSYLFSSSLSLLLSILLLLSVSIYYHCIISVFMVTLHFASCCLLACLLACSRSRTARRHAHSHIRFQPFACSKLIQFAKNWTERRKKETLRQPAFFLFFLSCSSFHEQTPMPKQEGQRPV